MSKKWSLVAIICGQYLARSHKKLYQGDKHTYTQTQKRMNTKTHKQTDVLEFRVENIII